MGHHLVKNRGNALTAVFRRTISALIGHVHGICHTAELDLSAGEQRHAGGVIPGSREVVPHDAFASESAAQTRNRLLVKLEAACESGTRERTAAAAAVNTIFFLMVIFCFERVMRWGVR